MPFALILPFFGTALGAACVFLPKIPGKPSRLNAFAAGVMTAASVWSLILPALERSDNSLFPVLAGIWLGFGFLHLARQLYSHCSDASLLTLAVALHNLPEGMAVGAAMVGFRTGAVTESALMALALGIAIQNIPEGAIISLPLRAKGAAPFRAFGWGALSGVIEPMGTVLTVCLAGLALPVLPWLLGFAAGAMLYVVAGELLPEAGPGGTLHFGAGFSLMMVLDVALG